MHANKEKKTSCGKITKRRVVRRLHCVFPGNHSKNRTADEGLLFHIIALSPILSIRKRAALPVRIFCGNRIVDQPLLGINMLRRVEWYPFGPTQFDF